jgi:hypothetical protein
VASAAAALRSAPLGARRPFAPRVIGAMSMATDLGLSAARACAQDGDPRGPPPVSSRGSAADSSRLLHLLLHSIGCVGRDGADGALRGRHRAPRQVRTRRRSRPEGSAFLMDVVGQDDRLRFVAGWSRAPSRTLEITRSTFALHCRSPSVVEAAASGRRCLEPGVHLRRWDGNRFPGGRRGVAPPRGCSMSRATSRSSVGRGTRSGGRVIEQRAGRRHDPHLAALATDHLDELLDGLDARSSGSRRSPPSRRPSGG